MLLNDRVPGPNHCWSDTNACELRCPTNLTKETHSTPYFYAMIDCNENNVLYLLSLEGET